MSPYFWNDSYSELIVSIVVLVVFSLKTLRPFQLKEKWYTNRGYKHDKTTPVVKTWLMT